MSDKTRLYVATDNVTKEPVALIRAGNASQAHRHLAQKKFTVAYAEQADIVKAVKAGIEEETAATADE